MFIFFIKLGRRVVQPTQASSAHPCTIYLHVSVQLFVSNESTFRLHTYIRTSKMYNLISLYQDTEDVITENVSIRTAYS